MASSFTSKQHLYLMAPCASSLWIMRISTLTRVFADRIKAASHLWAEEQNEARVPWSICWSNDNVYWEKPLALPKGLKNVEPTKPLVNYYVTALCASRETFAVMYWHVQTLAGCVVSPTYSRLRTSHSYPRGTCYRPKSCRKVRITLHAATASSTALI